MGNPQATGVSSSSFRQLSPTDDRLLFNPHDPPPSTLPSFIFFPLLFKFAFVFLLTMGHVIFFAGVPLLAFGCRIFKASSVFYTLHDIMKSSQAYRCFYLITAEVNQRGFTTKRHPEPFYFSLFLIRVIFSALCISLKIENTGRERAVLSHRIEHFTIIHFLSLGMFY